MKKSKKETRKRERKDWVEAEVNSNGKIAITFHPNGSVTFGNAISQTYRMTRTYDREGGKEKVLLNIPISEKNPGFDHLDNLKHQYDYLLAIDTNYQKMGELWIATTVAYFVPKPLRSYQRQVPYIFADAFYWIDRERQVDFEPRGWDLIFQQSLSGQYFKNPSIRLGVATDHGLGKLRDINLRNSPYFDGKFLPSFITLIYASDASADGLPNQMIRRCDQVANNVFEEIKKMNNSQGIADIGRPVRVRPQVIHSGL